MTLRPRHHALAYGALIALTLLTFGLSFVGLGGAGVPVALGIAATKALIVALVFMHLAEHPVSARLAFGIAWLFLGLMLALTLLDASTRDVPALPPEVTPPGPGI